MLITALYSVAQRVGPTRIFKAWGQFHQPLGDPTLNKDEELGWRTDMVRQALKALTVPMDQPLVFDVARE